MSGGRCDDDWLFASPFVNGKSPYWPDTILDRQLRPAAKVAGITRRIGWHTFRHSFAQLLDTAGQAVSQNRT
jgi:integrase